MGLKTRTAKILIALPSKSRTIRFLGRIREWRLPEPYACAPVVFAEWSRYSDASRGKQSLARSGG